MAAFVWSSILLIIGIGICMIVARRRPPGTPLTWGEAILAATYITGLMLLGYGIVPNTWLLWADNELRWRADSVAYIVRFWGRGRIVIPKQALRDVIATVIYGVILTVHFILWAQWQRRGKGPATAEIETSQFGRPLRRV